jgi:hypothetical protein
MANQNSNHFLAERDKGNIDFDADVFHLVLMATGFVFDPDTDANWSDISASELAGGNGYTQDGATLSGVAVSEDDTNNRSSVTWNNESWTATGGNIGPSPSACIVKWTGVESTSIIVGNIDFGGDQTALSGNPFSVQNIENRSNAI